MNLALTMILGGLWHGASWTFALWGAYHGALLIFYHRFKGLWDRLNARLATALTLALVCMGWVIFKSRNLWDLVDGLNGLFDFGRHATQAQALSQRLELGGLVLLGALYCASVDEYSAREDLDSTGPLAQAALGLVAVACLLSLGGAKPFLYFRF
jgi:alginate O-acetyltransferase complex protein AlgI